MSDKNKRIIENNLSDKKIFIKMSDKKYPKKVKQHIYEIMKKCVR